MICHIRIMGVLIICLMYVFRLSLETHKQSIAILEPENMMLKKECQHLKKVCFFHATVICRISSYCCHTFLWDRKISSHTCSVVFCVFSFKLRGCVEHFQNGLRLLKGPAQLHMFASFAVYANVREDRLPYACFVHAYLLLQTLTILNTYQICTQNVDILLHKHAVLQAKIAQKVICAYWFVIRRNLVC